MSEPTTAGWGIRTIERKTRNGDIVRIKRMSGTEWELWLPEVVSKFSRRVDCLIAANAFASNNGGWS